MPARVWGFESPLRHQEFSKTPRPPAGRSYGESYGDASAPPRFIGMTWPVTMSPAPEGIRIYLAQRASVFDQHALTDHITMSPEAGEQGSLVVRDGIEGGRSSEQESDPSGLARRLRFAAKRRGEEANGAHKPGAPVRYWMTWYERRGTHREATREGSRS